MERAAVFEAIMALLLVVLGTVLIIGVLDGPTDSGGNWTTSSVNATPYMYTGSDGTLYMFDQVEDGTNVYAIGQDGRVKWSYEVSEPWQAINNWERKPKVVRYRPDAGQFGYQTEVRPVFAVDNDTMYLYLRNSNLYSNSGIPDEVIAISGGRKLWEKPLTQSILALMYRDAWVQVSGDRLYVYHSYLLEVLGANGTFLYRIPDVSDPPALDDKGNVYVMQGGRSPDPEFNQGIQGAWDNDGLVPSGTLESYDSDGKLRWKTEVNGTPSRQDIDRTAIPAGGDIPLYYVGQLYVPLENGIIALDTDGNVLWDADVGDNVTLLRTMPFGTDGTVYMTRDTSYHPMGNQTPVIYTIAPGGSFTVAQPPSAEMDLLTASQGTGYYGQSRYEEDFMPGIDSLLPVSITAVDLRTGNTIWERGIVPAGKRTVVADRQNVLRLFEYSETAMNSIVYSEDHPQLQDNTGLVYYVLGNSRVNVLASGDVIYVSYYLYNYEHPIGYWNGTTYTRLFIFSGPETSAYLCPALLDRSRICYASGVAALDRDGNILWDKPIDSILTGIAVHNATLYYGTRNGGLSAVRTNIALGFTFIAALYMFFRFFLVGAVARARSRLNDNENRNGVLDLVRREPGTTMYEIARLLGMNPGTVRYHLFILGINHRIVTYRDGKYVRYFGNANAYSEAERAMISLLRRDWARKLFVALQESEGMSNARLARALGVSEPAVSSYLRELVKKGLVVRAVAGDGSVLYSVRSDYKENVAGAVRRLPELADT